MSHQPIQLFIKTLKGKTITLNGYPHSTISQIKDTIQHMELLPSNQMRLKYAGKDLADNGTLLSYDIRNLSTLDMTMRMKGGSLVFLDVSTGIMKDIELSSIGPERLTVHTGINIEGICNYKKCEDKGKLVICRIEGKTYDFVNEISKVLCPTCESMFKALNCGFLRCIFTFKGKKIDPSTNQSKAIERQENTQNSKYRTFDTFTTNDVNWIELKVTVDTDRVNDDNGNPL